MTDSNDQSEGAAARNRKRWILIALLVLFISPVVAGWLWTPTSFRNRGTLIEPPRPLVSVPLLAPESNRMELESVLGRWTYVLFIEGQCESSCLQWASGIERVRLSQGKNEKRIQLLIVTLDPNALDSLAALREEAPDLITLAIAPQESQALLSQFQTNGSGPREILELIYLVDPIGNLMMTYPRQSDPSDLRKDIGRLLRASRIG